MAQSAAITATNLDLIGSGAAYTLDNGSNSIGTLAANIGTGTVSLYDGISLSIGAVNGTSGVTAGNLTLSVNGTISDPSAAVSISDVFNLANGNWSQISAALPSFSAHDFRISGGSFMRVSNGSTANIGSASNPYLISDIYGLQGMGALSGSYVRLANTIDASGTTNWNAGAGFAPIGFGGTFNGEGFAINNLTIDRPNSNYVGLFGWVNATVENLTLDNVNIIGDEFVGGLFGRIDGGTTSGIAISGTVQGQDYVGGLAGVASTNGSIVYSLSSANVTGHGSIGFVGGLVGDDGDAISQSGATGNVVSSAGYVGGLVGYLYNPGIYTPASLTNTYATGNVGGSGAYYVGGLAGAADAGTSITTSYSIGKVTAGSWLGGLVGLNYGATFANSYFDTTTSGQQYGTANGNVGGVTGLTDLQMLDLSAYATNYAGFDFTNIWAPPNQAGQGGSNAAYYPELYALTPVVTVGINDVSRVYGQTNPAFTDSVIGGGPGTYVLGPAGDTLNPSLTLSTSATQFSDIGPYSITANTNTATSTDGVKYRVIVVPGTLTVTPEQITITADSGQTKTYGTNDPTLTYMVTVGTLYNGNQLSGALSRLGYGMLAGEQVGNYAITLGSLTAGSNYAVTIVPGVNFSITPKSLTVTANAQNKTYGTNDPTLTYSQNGLVSGVVVDGVLINDTMTGSLSRAAYGMLAGEQVGTYAIGPGTLAPSSNNYTVSYTGANLTITPASLSITANAQNKTYATNDPTLTYSQNGLVSGVTVDGVQINDTLTGSLARAQYGTLAGEQVGSYAIGQGTLAPSSSNYKVSYTGANLTITPKSLIITANAQNKTYATNDPTLTYSQNGLVSGVTVDGVQINDTMTGSLSRLGYGTLAGEQVGTYAIGQGTLAPSSNNYSVSYTGANLTIAPRPVTVAADPQTKVVGAADPSLTYTTSGVTNNPASGLVNGVMVDGVFMKDTLAGALTRVAGESQGSYLILQGTITNALNPNYNIAYLPNALTITVPTNPGNNPSQVAGPSPTPSTTQPNINFQSPNTGANLVRVTFTPNGTTTANNQNNNDVNPASLPPGNTFMHNNGRYFPPISQYDADQYSDFKLPPYDKDDSQATVLTIIARGIAQAEASKYMIDGFWNGTEDTWPGASHVDLLGKATFSDGAGHNVTPTNDPAFPIVAGKTDFAALLNNGPVVIGGPADQTPPKWLLATAMTPDGKGIICDDTQTGGLVELAYDPTTKTVSGITGVFDAKKNSFVALAEAGNDIPASNVSGLTGLQSFVPSTYYAVTVH